ncbi:hypothetical protein HZ326_22446 [Fusarium oxysporum f. sp. albedinis]|nr:hypothetical protein HZ326_22446 [Fusarium oxysporum f. sp. albedinis]
MDTHTCLANCLYLFEIAKLFLKPLKNEPEDNRHNLGVLASAFFLKHKDLNIMFVYANAFVTKAWKSSIWKFLMHEYGYAEVFITSLLSRRIRICRKDSK